MVSNDSNSNTMCCIVTILFRTSNEFYSNKNALYKRLSFTIQASCVDRNLRLYSRKASKKHQTNRPLFHFSI